MCIRDRIDDLPVAVELAGVELTKDEERKHHGALENIPEIEGHEDGKARKEHWRQWSLTECEAA